MTKEDKQIIDRGIEENWRIGDRTRLKHLLEKNLEQYRENVELEQQIEHLTKEVNDLENMRLTTLQKLTVVKQKNHRVARDSFR